MTRTAVVAGAGVSGMALAFELLQRAGGEPLRVRCLEGSDRPGGNIRTDREGGYTCEWGPNGFLDNAPATLELVRRLGIPDRIYPADEQSKIRYIFRKGKLRRVPTGPGAFLTSGVLSPTGKLRVLGEPWANKRPENGDESVFDFATRRIGREAARVLVAAMVTGIYAGDARQLCLRSTFPKMYHMESEYGGLVRAMIGKLREARRLGGSSGGPAGPGGHLTSFRNGMQELIDALAAAVGDALELNRRVKSVRKTGPGYAVELADGDAIEADAVVLAGPAWHAAPLVRELDAELAAAIEAIPSAPVAVVHLGFDERAIERRPRGFGYLVPRDQGARILGTLWSSNIFPGRAPEGKLLMTVMVGGALDPGAMQLDDDGLLRLVRNDLAVTMDLAAEPEMVQVFRHPHGIPQYTLGHIQRMETIERRLAGHPGLFVHGNSYRGISVNLCVERSPDVANAVLSHVG